MKKLKRILACFLMSITALAPVANVSAATEITSANEFYTYFYDYFEIEMQSPDTYKPDSYVLGTDLGEEVGNFKNPQGLFVRDELIYIVDSGNNRIVVVDNNFKLVRVIDKVILNGEESTLKNPQDVFVTPNGDLYICDTDNNRAIHCDKDLNVIKLYLKPDDANLSSDISFTPAKGVVDTAGRLYLLVTNTNKGFFEFDQNGEFTGFIGANKVTVSLFEVIKKRLMTKEQRARMELFVPTEYSNIAIDKDNFLYTTTDTFNNSNSVDKIRKLNSLGADILIRNGYTDPVGDLYWSTRGEYSGPSRFMDITPLENDTYFALDRIRGRIFAYDYQGNLLYAFGGIGNKLGYFGYPVAIEHQGTDILVLDNRYNSITRFKLTDYGKLINDALELYKEGRYDESADLWREVMRYNGGYDYAYIGIGRSLLRQGRYKEAMEYFEAKRDVDNYSKAFAEYRRDWVEANIGYMVAGFIALILLPKIIKLVKKLIKGGARKDEYKDSFSKR